MKIIDALLQILALIGQWVEQHRRNQKAKEDQEEHDKISDSPADWMRDHFDRVRELPGDADKASETPHRDSSPDGRGNSAGPGQH